MRLPPFVKAEDRVILFDGVCKLCNGWALFIIKHDRHRRFKLCSVQSTEGRAMLQWCDLPTDTFETMVLVENGVAYKQSDAFLKLMSELPRPWHYVALLKVFPRRIRNWLYNRIALNRYRLFGRYDRCAIPDKDSLDRFIEHE